MKRNFSPLILLAILLAACGPSEQDLYQKASESGAFADYHAYIAQFPDGVFSGEVNEKLAAMRAKMHYTIDDNNWDFRKQDYDREFSELHRIFQSQTQNIQMSKSVKEVKLAWRESVASFWQPPVTVEHFEQLNALGCWAREMASEGMARGLESLLLLYAERILTQDLMTQTGEDVRLLKTAVLDWILDMSVFADFTPFLEVIKENEIDATILNNVDDLLAKIQSMY